MSNDFKNHPTFFETWLEDKEIQNILKKISKLIIESKLKKQDYHIKILTPSSYGHPDDEDLIIIEHIVYEHKECAECSSIWDDREVNRYSFHFPNFKRKLYLIKNVCQSYIKLMEG